jgi:hypothetical protein
MKNQTAIGLILIAIFTFAMTGCSNSDFGEVTGTVTIDGEPAPAGLNIIFEPQVEGGSQSGGITQEGGAFEMHFTRDQKGVMVGTSIVRIEKSDDFDEEAAIATSGSEAVDRLRIPPEFGSESTFEVEVKPGEQVIDIPITTK